MTERVPIAEASALLGISKQAIRIQMQRGILDIGLVMPSSKGNGKIKQYLIFREKLNKVLGRPADEPGE